MVGTAFSMKENACFVTCKCLKFEVTKVKRKAIIIDDEPFIRDDLREMLAAHRDIEVVGEAGTIAEAKKLLASRRFDVVFLDIQLRGGTGFDLLPFIDPSTQIVFITAHDEYAVRAFEINALDPTSDEIGLTMAYSEGELDFRADRMMLAEGAAARLTLKF